MKRHHIKISENKHISINVLNNDTLSTIFSFLPISDILKIYRTTKEFKYIVETNSSVWEHELFKCDLSKSLQKNKIKNFLNFPLTKLLVTDKTNSYNPIYHAFENMPLKEIYMVGVMFYSYKFSYINMKHLKTIYLSHGRTQILESLQNSIFYFINSQEHICRDAFWKSTEKRFNVNLHELRISDCELITSHGYQYLKNISTVKLRLKNIHNTIYYEQIFKNLHKNTTILFLNSHRFIPNITQNDLLLLHDNITTLSLKNFYNIFHFPKKIKTLFLENISIETGNILEYLPESLYIEELVCNNSDLKHGDYKSIGMLKKLKKLTILHDEDFNYKCLEYLEDSKIEYLTIDSCESSNVNDNMAIPLSLLDNLKYLTLNDCDITHLFTYIISLSCKLEYLKISMAYNFTNKGLVYLTDIKSIKELELDTILKLDNNSVHLFKKMKNTLKKLTIYGSNDITEKYLYNHYLPNTDVVFSK